MATPQEVIADGVYGVEMATRLEAAEQPPIESPMVAAIAAPHSVRIIKPMDVRDESIVRLVRHYLDRINWKESEDTFVKYRDELVAKGLGKYLGIDEKPRFEPRWRNLRVDTRIRRLARGISIVEVTIFAQGGDFSSCEQCQDRTFEFLVRDDVVIDLWKEKGAAGQLCGGLHIALDVFGRTYIYSWVGSCGTDDTSPLIQDISGKVPKILEPYFAGFR